MWAQFTVDTSLSGKPVPRGMGFFCRICQRSFQNERSYGAHAGSAAHARAQRDFDADPLAHRTRLTSRFVSHFVSFIANKSEYTELNTAYQQYIAGNRYRIRGTRYRTLAEAVGAIRDRVSVRVSGGEYHVKRLEGRVVAREVDLEDLHDAPGDWPAGG